MGDLDDELKKALADSEAEGKADPGVVRSGATASEGGSSEAGAGAIEAPAVALGAAPDEPKRNIGLLIGLLVAAGGILALVFTSVDEAAIYSVTTDQLVTQKDEYVGRNVRVEGDLVSGSLRHRKEPCEYRFSIQKNGHKLPVSYPACVVPDTFKDVPGIDVQVTAEGKLNESGNFDATHIMAKCPSKYEMEQRAANGEQAPHDIMGSPPPLAPGEK
jgi:cytochrome c-type biogenesis protein CcmE